MTGYALSGLDLGDGWRWMLGLSAAPALVVIALVVLMPESPRWLMGKGRMCGSFDIILDHFSRSLTHH